jgi:hypothetical protein
VRLSQSATALLILLIRCLVPVGIANSRDIAAQPGRIRHTYSAAMFLIYSLPGDDFWNVVALRCGIFRNEQTLPSETDFTNTTRADNKAKNNSRNNASGITRSEQFKQDGQAASARIAKKSFRRRESKPKSWLSLSGILVLKWFTRTLPAG